MKKMGDFLRCVVAAGLVAGLAGCGGGAGGDPQWAQPSPSVSRSTEPPYVPSPIKTVTLESKPTTPVPETTPPECRYATPEEIESITGETITGQSVLVGGCWYRLAGQSVTTCVKVTVFRNKVLAGPEEGWVSVAGLGGKAYWDDGVGGLYVQAGRTVVWIDVGYIQADDKLERAKKLFAVVRRRL